ncbi:MAG: gliding motility-associated C-terminal domain-containing protein [Bacteroidales bacterium]|nr:gliding motility-associated C-terminal domain-containing protein [Bacteroidales bacterium]
MMKKFILIFFIVLVSQILISQEPISPNLCYVTVNEDSTCHVFWNHPDTASIQGFIIKRVIFDGTGVVNGTLNNVAVIYDNSITSFIDTTYEYFTNSNPYLRSEQYAVSAFLSRNDSIILSNMSFPQKTIFLTAEWDFCNQIANLNWTKYINKDIQKYNIFYGTNQNNLQLLTEISPNDTSYSTENLLKNTQYYFKIEAVINETNSCEPAISVSNFDDFFTGATVIPDTLQNIYVTTIDNSNIEVLFYCSENFGIEKLVLQRDNDELLYEFSGQQKYLKYNDLTDANLLYYYSIKIVDICGLESFIPQSYNNLVLDVIDENKNFYLTWNNILINNNAPEFYEIEVNNNGNWELIKTVQGLTNNDHFSYNDIYNNINYNSDLQFISFRIIGKYDTTFVFSNIIQLPVVGLFSIPNAFNPYSSNTENSYFTIKCEFVNSYYLEVYTETGSIIFKSDDINYCWSGRYSNGQVVQRGSYIYSITYEDNSGNKHKINGIINVVY